MKLAFLAALVAMGFGLLGCTSTDTPDPTLTARDSEFLATAARYQVDNDYSRRKVDDPTGETPGTIVVDTKVNQLYYVLPNRQAMRYAVATGSEAYGWTGTAYVKTKKEWPTWLPPVEMVQRWPNLQPVRDMGGVPGGPGNPLGARALYLFDDKGHDTLYRIHGTNEPEKIGQSVSSGCIRMANIDAIDLYSRVQIGTKVIVR